MIALNAKKHRMRRMQKAVYPAFFITLAIIIYIFAMHSIMGMLLPGVRVIQKHHSDISYEVDYKPGQSGIFQIIPTRCITDVFVNGTALDLSNVMPWQRCSKNYNGFVLDLAPHFTAGKNIVRIELELAPMLKVRGSLAVFQALVFNTNAALLPGVSLVMLFVAGLLWVALQKKMLDMADALLFVSAIILYIICTNNSTYTRYANDVNGHLQYIRYVYRTLSIPPPSKGWQYYHPPLYYVISAVFFGFGKAIRLPDPAVYLRYVSIIYYCIFLLFGFLTLKRYINWRPVYYACLLVLVLWPNGATYAGKINNDVLFYPLAAMILYFWLRWKEDSRISALSMAIIAIACAILVKSTALVCVGLLAIDILFSLYCHNVTKKNICNRRIAFAVIILIMAVSLNFGRTLYYRALEDTNQPLIVGNADADMAPRWMKKLTVENTLNNFISFDLNMFVSNPFFVPTDDSTGRQLFWVAMSKTLLYGDEIWANEKAASYLNIVFIVLVIYMVATGGCTLRHKSAQYKVVHSAGAYILIFITALLVMRLRIPNAAMENARYIYPIIVPALLCCGVSVSGLQGKSVLKIISAYTGVGILLLFACLSLWLLLVEFRLTYG